jgi:hypothetical protein
MRTRSGSSKLGTSSVPSTGIKSEKTSLPLKKARSAPVKGSRLGDLFRRATAAVSAPR